MPADPELLRRLAVCLQAMGDVLAHPDIQGTDEKAMKGAKADMERAMGTVRYIRFRQESPRVEEPEPRKLWGIERSLPEGDRE